MVAVRRLVKDSSLVAFGQAGAMAALFVQGLLIARHLGPSGYGHWALILGTFNFLASFLSFRTSDSLTAFWVDVRYESHTSRRYLFFAALYMEIVTKVAAAALGIVATLWWVTTDGVGSPEAIAVYLCALAKSLGVLTPIWISLVRASRQMPLFSSVPAIQAWVSLAAVAITFQTMGASLLAVAIALLVSEAVGLAIRWRTMPLRVAPAGSEQLLVGPRKVYEARSEMAPFWRMMGAGYVSSCLSSVMKEADILVIGWLGTPIAAGFYRAAKSLVTIMQTGIATLSTVIIQDFADAIRRKQLDKVRKLLRRVLPVVTAVVLAGSIAAAFGIEKFLVLVLGPEFAGARTPFLYLLPGVAIATALFWVQPLAVTLQSSKILLRVALLNFAAYVVTLGIASPFIGPWAAALALSVAWGVGHVAVLVLIWPTLRGPTTHGAPA